MQKKSLGRGLSSLFETVYSGEEEDVEKATRSLLQEDLNAQEKVQIISITHLVPGPFQPRKRFQEEEIRNLAVSIEKQGILQPLLVRLKAISSLEEKGNEERGDTLYEIIAGERRWRAALYAGLREVPVLIKEIENKQGLEIALIENIQRENLTPLEEAEAYAKLIEEAGYTQEILGEIIGKSRSHVTNTLRLLLLPDSIKALLQEEKISAGHARSLINQENPETLAELVIQKRLSVRQLEEYLRRKSTEIHTKDSEEKHQKKSLKVILTDREKLPEIKSLEEALTQQIGLQTELHLNEEGNGKITIHIQSFDDLDSFFQKLLSSAHPIVVSEA